MCGLFGVMGPDIQKQDLDAFRELGMVSQLRGIDSSGVFQTRVRTKGMYSGYSYEAIYKTSENFSSFLQDIDHPRTNAPRSLLFTSMVDVVLGHVRSATKGSINDENAHPFVFKGMVAAHNGTLLDRQYSDFKKTDSELMFADMEDRGIIPVLENMNRDSAYALSIFDRNTKKMIFVRNELRPLYFAFLYNRAVMYWASDLEMLRFVLGRKNLRFRSINLTPGMLVSVDVNHIKPKPDNAEEYELAEALKNFRLIKKLDRQLPTEVVKQNEAWARYMERQAEEKAKKDAEKDVPETDYGKNLKINGKTDVKPKAVVQGGKVDKEALKKATDAWKDAADKTAQEAGGDNVVPFKHQQQSVPQVKTPPRNKKKGSFTSKALHGKCACGCKTLNLVECSKASRGVLPGIRYDEPEDKFYCLNCDPAKEIVNKA